MKNKYEHPEMEVLFWTTQDIITLSDGTGTDNGEGSDVIPLGEEPTEEGF